MTEEEQTLLVDLKANTQQIFHAYRDLKQEKYELKNKVESLNREIESLQNEKSKLNSKIEQLKIATQLLSGVDESGETKHKIDKLIREIDKCIALLNK